jgi:hypothetical protein
MRGTSFHKLTSRKAELEIVRQTSQFSVRRQWQKTFAAHILGQVVEVMIFAGGAPPTLYSPTPAGVSGTVALRTGIVKFAKKLVEYTHGVQL